MLLTRLLILSILLFNTFANRLNDHPKDKSIFIPPVKIPLLLSANFGELRVDHFHSGIDIKTQGVTGQEVIAAASGYVYRINVSPGGFGNALYVRHASGYSTVYGHLEKFTPEIEDYVKSQQYAARSFMITLFPPKDRFPVRQGELIAYSGNSGSSSGPHLHYEIRKSANEIPVNPLLFEFGLADEIKPVIEKLAIYPINRNTLISNQNEVKKINVSGGNGNYHIPGNNGISVSGMTGFGIKTYDLLNDSHNRCAVYSIELQIDSTPIYKYIMDAFSFNESRFINSHIDYEAYQKENIYIERTFILPNDKLSVYKDVTRRGIYNFDDDKIHNVEISVTDIHNNKSVLTFKIKADKSKTSSTAQLKDKNMKIMPYNRSNKFEAENLIINIPSGALYDTLFFTYKSTPRSNEMYSDLHHIHDRFTPLQRAIAISIKPSVIPVGKESKMAIIQVGDDMRKSTLSSRWSDGYMSAETLTFGKFYIGIDSIAPIISPNGLNDGANLTGRKEIKIRITDDLSGIKSYEGYIDDKWALFEYDSKNNLLVYRFDDKRITVGTNHSLLLKVTDNVDNLSQFRCDFRW